MTRGKLVAVLAIATFFGLGTWSTAEAQWGGCQPAPVYRSYSVGYGPGWNAYNGIYGYNTRYHGVPAGYYRSVGYYSYPGVYSVQRVVVPAPVVRPIVVAPGWGSGFGPGWGGGFGPGWGSGFGPGWGGSGVSLRVGF